MMSSDVVHSISHPPRAKAWSTQVNGVTDLTDLSLGADTPVVVLKMSNLFMMGCRNNKYANLLVMMALPNFTFWDDFEIEGIYH